VSGGADGAHGGGRAAPMIEPDDPRADDVRGLLETHLAFAASATPAAHVHALDVEQLLDPAVSFYSARRDGLLLGVGALRELDGSHGEIKSMHTSVGSRRDGVGRAMVEHLLGIAASRGYERVSLETGTGEEFAPARSLYASLGFVPCAPFGHYTVNEFSMCMTLELRR
jgi:putative acetyltransferase